MVLTIPTVSIGEDRYLVGVPRHSRTRTVPGRVMELSASAFPHAGYPEHVRTTALRIVTIAAHPIALSEDGI
jgi:hypothetical protein